MRMAGRVLVPAGLGLSLAASLSPRIGVSGQPESAGHLVQLCGQEPFLTAWFSLCSKVQVSKRLLGRPQHFHLSASTSLSRCRAENTLRPVTKSCFSTANVEFSRPASKRDCQGYAGHRSAGSWRTDMRNRSIATGALRHVTESLQVLNTPRSLPSPVVATTYGQTSRHSSRSRRGSHARTLPVGPARDP